jgi:hypothetical protein
MAEIKPACSAFLADAGRAGKPKRRLPLQLLPASPLGWPCRQCHRDRSVKVHVLTCLGWWRTCGGGTSITKSCIFTITVTYSKGIKRRVEADNS